MLRRRSQSRERGVALLMVITVLVTLVIIAVAFAPQMERGRLRTETNSARSRADFEARQLARLVQLFLSGSHPKNERARAEDGDNAADADERVDTIAEITPGDEFRARLIEAIESGWMQDPALSEKLERLQRRELSPLNDDRGSIWTVLVQDAQACVNVNGASPYLIGNLLGSALLSEDVDPSAPDIAVEHVAQGKLAGLGGFSPVDGLIRIGNEVISYEEFDGTSFRGCERGIARETPLSDNGSSMSHKKGTAVIDYTAYKLATHLISRRPGHLTPFESFEDLRSIGTWGEAGTFSAHRLAQLRPFLTLYSRRESAEGWLAAQLVVEQLPTSIDGDASDVVKVRDTQNPSGTTTWFNAGTLVRITDGLNTAYQTVANVGDPDGRLVDDREVTLSGRVDAGRPEDAPALVFEGGRTLIAAMSPYPININTAPVEVLYAVMVNLQHRFAKEEDQIVTPDIAWQLAEDIVRTREGKFEAVPGTDEGVQWRRSGPFRNAEDFGRFLKERVNTAQLTRAQEFALYTNSINPHANSLQFGTAPWCFRTLDVYHVESRVVINDRGGDQIADTTIREVVEIGADEITAWSIDSQADFEERLQMGSGAKWTATYPFGVTYLNNGQHHVQPRQRAPKHIAREVYPSIKVQDDATVDDIGDVRLEPVRMRLPGAVVVEHFDGNKYQDGHFTGYDGAYTRKVAGAFLGNQDTYVQPFSMSFWWRSFSEADSWTAFDCGMDRYLNRYAVYVTDREGERQLVFRACAGTLERRGAEVYVPLARLDYRPGTWYHIHVSCAGEDPSTMQLLIDGLDLSERRGFTQLESGLSQDSEEVIVERTAGFPPMGAIQVGSEIIEYDLLDPSSFRTCVRGARGTGAGDWPAGTPVRLLGYSMPLLVDVMAGGAHLDEDLAIYNALRVTGDGGSETLGGTINGVDAQVRGYGLETAPQDLVVEGMWGYTAEEAASAFGSSGYALLGCRRIPGGVFSELTSGWEIVYYTRNGVSFQIEQRYEHTEWQTSAPDPFFLVNHRLDTDTDWPCYLVPISVIAQAGGSQAGDDYLNPLDPEHQKILAAYGGDGRGRVLIGSAAPDLDQYEIVEYDSIERQRSAPDILFVSHRYVVNLANYFFGTDVEAKPGIAAATPPPAPDDEDPDGEEPVPDPVTDPGGEPLDPTGEPDSSEGDSPSSTSDGEPGAAGDSDDSSGGTDTGPPPTEVEPPPDGSGEGEREDDDDDRPPVGQVPQVAPDRSEGTPILGMEPAGGRAGALASAYFRGRLNTFDREHIAGGAGDRNARVLPCFRVFEGGSEGNLGRRAGRNDRITIVAATADGEAPERVEAMLRWGHTGSDWVALDDFVDKRVRAPEEGATATRLDQRGRPRILKFPCGELPDELPLDMEFGRSTISNSDIVTAFLDELHIWRHGVGPECIVADVEGVEATSTEIMLSPEGWHQDGTAVPIENSAGWDPDCGVFLLNGELIVYRGTSSEANDRVILERCMRGMFGTEARFHPPGSYGRLLPDVPVSYLEGNVPKDAASIPLVHTRRWPREGLARIIGREDAELIHFTRRTDRDLLMPEVLDVENEYARGTGLFRGRFGTDAIDHDSDSVVIFTPFRYWDRYTPRDSQDNEAFSGVYDHAETSYVELGLRRDNAYWHSIRWERNLDGMRHGENLREEPGGTGADSGFRNVILLARFSPNVPWDSSSVIDLRSGSSMASSRQAHTADALYVFDDPRAANDLGFEANTAQVRVYFEYKPDAYVFLDTPGAAAGSLGDDLVLTNEWKKTPWFQSLLISYTNRTRTLSSAKAGKGR